jgi:hypothetical protein
MPIDQARNIGQPLKRAFQAGADLALLLEALAALLRERSVAYSFAAEIAGAKGLHVPTVDNYALPGNLRLNRLLVEEC